MQSGLRDLRADVGAERAVHRGPHLVVTLPHEADAIDRARRGPLQAAFVSHHGQAPRGRQVALRYQITGERSMANSQPQRAAIVTGGASGIGLAAVERLLAAGWRVTALDRDEAALAKLRRAHGDTLRIGLLDVTDEAAAEAAVSGSAQAFGRIDGLVNSAGIGLDKPVL